MNLATTDKNISTEVSSFIQRRLGNVSDHIRTQALEIFQQLGLPGPKHEEYKYTPLSRELEKNFSFQNVATEHHIKDVKEFLIPGVEANILVFLNGVYSAEHSVIISPSSQLTIQNLEEALDELF